MPILVKLPEASILTVPDPLPVAIEVVALNVPGALRSVGRDRVTFPVEAEAVIWFVVPVIEVTAMVERSVQEPTPLPSLVKTLPEPGEPPLILI